MTVPNQRDPDETDILRQLRTGADEQKKLSIARWGRVPHLGADPVNPPNGAVWIRSDTADFRYQAGGTTVGMFVAIDGGDPTSTDTLTIDGGLP